MKVFVDTSALLAVLDADEKRHKQAASAWKRLLEEDARLVTTNYVLVESFALSVLTTLGPLFLTTYPPLDPPGGDGR